MKGYLLIDSDKIGEVDFKITDENMGGIGGQFLPYDTYKSYQETIQQQCNEKGISNLDDFNYCILLEDNTELKPEGGIGITDINGFDEIYVESAGLDRETIEKLKNAL